MPSSEYVHEAVREKTNRCGKTVWYFCLSRCLLNVCLKTKPWTHRLVTVLNKPVREIRLKRLKRVKRGQLWEVDFELQTHILNAAGHATIIVIPGTTQVYRHSQGDGYPLRISIGKAGLLKEESALLINQIRTVPNGRLKGNKPSAALGRAHLKSIEDALSVLMGW